jgi:hypothetical protein
MVAEPPAGVVTVETREDLLLLLRNPLLWEETPEIVSVAEIAAIVREADAERARASALCDRLLTGPPLSWAASFHGDPDARTPAVVQQLLARVPALRERRPLDACRATAIAVAIAGDLDLTEHAPEHVEIVRGQALWEHASVLASLHRYPEALGFAESAERTFAQVDTPGFDLDGLAQLKESLLELAPGHGHPPVLAAVAY